jgi:hypothetical protein
MLSRFAGDTPFISRLYLSSSGVPVQGYSLKILNNIDLKLDSGTMKFSPQSADLAGTSCW